MADSKLKGGVGLDSIPKAECTSLDCICCCLKSPHGSGVNRKIVLLTLY